MPPSESLNVKEIFVHQANRTTRDCASPTKATHWHPFLSHDSFPTFPDQHVLHNKPLGIFVIVVLNLKVLNSLNNRDL
jgi:hypothetical protein